MELEVHGVKGQTPNKNLQKQSAAVDVQNAQRARETAQRSARERAAAATAAENAKKNAAAYIEEILNYTQFFNKRLRFSVNQELEQVVVKVIDAKTDKVIKEIPPEVLQRLHIRIREAIGLLIDETI